MVLVEPEAPPRRPLTALETIQFLGLPGMLGALLPALALMWHFTPWPFTLGDVALAMIICALPQTFIVGALLGAGGGVIVRQIVAGRSIEAPSLNFMTAGAAFLTALVTAGLLDVLIIGLSG
jgi:hypothetical protein